jgi:Ca2+-dependent lipid-binding protein
MDVENILMHPGKIGDAYIYYETKGAKLRTQTIDMMREGKKDTALPVIWNEEMMLPIEMPISNDTLSLNLYDSDFPKPDELVSTMNFSYKQIIKESD